MLRRTEPLFLGNQVNRNHCRTQKQRKEIIYLIMRATSRENFYYEITQNIGFIMITEFNINLYCCSYIQLFKKMCIWIK